MDMQPKGAKRKAGTVRSEERVAQALNAFANETATDVDGDAWLLLVSVMRDSASQIRRAATAVESRPDKRSEPRN